MSLVTFKLEGLLGGVRLVYGLKVQGAPIANRLEDRCSLVGLDLPTPMEVDDEPGNVLGDAWNGYHIALSTLLAHRLGEEDPRKVLRV